MAAEAQRHIELLPLQEALGPEVPTAAPMEPVSVPPVEVPTLASAQETPPVPRERRPRPVVLQCWGAAYRRRDIDRTLVTAVLAVCLMGAFGTCLGLYGDDYRTLAASQEGTCVRYSLYRDNSTGEIMACWKLKPSDDISGVSRPYCQRESSINVPLTRLCL